MRLKRGCHLGVLALAAADAGGKCNIQSSSVGSEAAMQQHGSSDRTAAKHAGASAVELGGPCWQARQRSMIGPAVMSLLQQINYGAGQLLQQLGWRSSSSSAAGGSSGTARPQAAVNL
jgi:hypothetical protein